MTTSAFNKDADLDYLTSKMFLDEDIGMQRFDVMKYKQFDKLTEKQWGFFWQPTEVNVTKDASDFKKLTDHEQHIFTSNLKRQILLDSVQGRSPNLAFLPLVSLPEVETWIETWSANETIHSRSYTHIIRNVYSNPSDVFDNMMSIREIVDCATDISEHYDTLITNGMWYNLLGTGTHTVNGDKIEVDEYELKKMLWMAINSVNILEGVRFYVSFACSWAFAELKKMEGNAKIIKFIARDENLHLASTQQILKLLPKDDPDFEKIRKETEQQCIDMFVQAVEQEKSWAKYLFKDGSIIGLNEQLLGDYIEWIAQKRMTAIGLPVHFKVPQANPLPWTNKWIAGSEVQVAPQETEISSYILNGTVNDITDDTFKDFKL